MGTPLLTLYGTIAIYPYGVALCIGVLVATWFASRHPWAEQLSLDRLMHFINGSVLVGILGARVLHIITEPQYYHTYTDMFLLWEGGLSSWGAIVALLIFIPLYTYSYHIPLLITLDLCALHAPLVHFFSRFGCFFAGCCGGMPTTLPWGIVNSAGAAVHPTQFYSALFFLCAFGALTLCNAVTSFRPGQALAFYLCCVGSERFLLDWLRDDRVFPSPIPYLSIHQAIALCIITVGLIGWVLTHYKRTRSYEYF